MQSGVLLYSVELKKETHMQFLTLSISLGIITLITACGEAPVSSSTNQPEKTEEAPVVSFDHGKENTSTEKLSTETITIAGVTIRVSAQGTMKPKQKYQIAIGLIDGEKGAVIRVWIGGKTKAGSMVFKAQGHGDHYHAHAEVPDEVNSQTALWLEVQSVSGETETGSISLQ
jgi:hypothetical protein